MAVYRELVARIHLRRCFRCEEEGRADVAHVRGAESDIRLSPLERACFDRDVVIGSTVECQTGVQDHFVAAEGNRAPIVTVDRVVGCIDREGFNQGARAILLEEQLERGAIGTRFHVFTESQYQVVIQAHCGGVVDGITARHRFQMAVGAEVNRAVGCTQTRRCVTVDVHQGLQHHRLRIGVGLQDDLEARPIRQGFFGVDGDLFVVECQYARAGYPATRSAVG